MSIYDFGFAVKTLNWIFLAYWLENEGGGCSEMFCLRKSKCAVWFLCYTTEVEFLFSPSGLDKYI